MSGLRLSVELLQTKRRKTIKSYLAAGGGIQHFHKVFNSKFGIIRPTSLTYTRSMLLLIRIQTKTNETVYQYCYETNLLILQCRLKLQKENRISGLKKGKFRRLSSTPEAWKEHSCQSCSASHITWRAECSFHRPTFIRTSWLWTKQSRACVAKKTAFKRSFLAMYKQDGRPTFSKDFT